LGLGRSEDRQASWSPGHSRQRKQRLAPPLILQRSLQHQSGGPMLQPSSDDFEGLVNQMQIMQSFIAPSEMLDRMDQGEQIPPEDIYAAAAQQYVDRVEEQRAQAQPQPPPARNLPFVTQPDPHEAEPDNSDDFRISPRSRRRSCNCSESSRSSGSRKTSSRSNRIEKINFFP